MTDVQSTTQAKEQTITAVITRADGTVEHLGVISYYNKNPLKQLWWHLKNWFAGR